MENNVLQSPSEMWAAIKHAPTVEQIDAIDKLTAWKETEPEWWLEMMAARRTLVLRKEIWDVGQCPFLLFAAAKTPGCAVRLIDGYTLESIGGYVPHDWNGIQYDVLDMHEADKMRRNHPEEFAKYAQQFPPTVNS